MAYADGFNSQDKPLGYEKITGLSSPKSLNAPSGARFAIIAVDGNTVRYRDDGVDPTATEGMPLGAGVMLTYEGILTAIRFIEIAASATLYVSYYA